MTDAASMFEPLPLGRLNGQKPSLAEPSIGLVVPVPDNAPEPPLLRGSRRWWYRDASGRRLYAIDRYEPRKEGGGKNHTCRTRCGERRMAL